MKTNHSKTETKRWIRTSPGIKAAFLLLAMIVSESQPMPDLKFYDTSLTKSLKDKLMYINIF